MRSWSSAILAAESSLARGAAAPYISLMSKLGIAVAAALALAAMGVAWQAWTSMADVEVGLAGTIAMILGAVAAIALGGALVALLIISNRRGFDAAAGARPIKPPEVKPQDPAES